MNTAQGSATDYKMVCRARHNNGMQPTGFARG